MDSVLWDLLMCHGGVPDIGIVGRSSAGSGILFGLPYSKDEGNIILQHIGTTYPFTR
jgi:hypothetical protein